MIQDDKHFGEWQEYHHKAAASHFAKKEFENCIEQSKKALLLQTNIKTLKRLVVSLGRIGKKKQSIRALELCTSLSNNCFNSLELVSVLALNEEFAKAADILLSILSESNDPRAHRLFAKLRHAELFIL